MISKRRFLANAEEYLPRDEILKIRPASEFKEKYNVLKLLGNGAFAEVHLVEDKQTKDLFAVKLIDRSAIRSAKHLWGELHTLYHLDHPNVIHLHEAYANATYVIFVLEYARGGELFDRLASQEEYSEADARNIIKQLVSAVAYLHKNKIVHRDIKPENILFTDESEDCLKLTDFGLSGIVNENSLLYSCAGTPNFMAPEILKNQGHASPCDLWSIGVLAYLLLGGSLPFESKIPFEMYKNIVEGKFNFGPGFDSVSYSARDFIQRCLVVDQSKRITAEDALGHGWFAEGEEVRARGLLARESILNVLQELKDRKEFKKTGTVVSFISKLRARSKFKAGASIPVAIAD
jgi:serine/threonine protein kinase